MVWSAEEAAGETVVIITVRALCFVVLKDSCIRHRQRYGEEGEGATKEGYENAEQNKTQFAERARWVHVILHLEHEGEFAAAVGHVAALGVQGADALLERQQRLVDLRAFHAPLPVVALGRERESGSGRACKYSDWQCAVV
jgi:hypothetical protein